MIQCEEKKKCSGCMACFNACPKNCIQMKEDKEGFWYPVIDEEVCINCGKCERVCPYISDIIPSEDAELCYAAYNKNGEDREKSSSGGIFIALAKYVLELGGVVYGAAFDEQYMVQHQRADTVTELEKLMGSKYIQSRLNLTYQDILEQLLAGRKVMFVGTTCQVAGLRGFLGKDFENLFTIDFICLGVPSPRVWSDYLKTFYNKKNIKYVNFKDKTLGWHNFSLRIDDPNKQTKSGRETYFFTGYFRQLYSRPSCSECYFKGKNRVSDITISDCWGYRHIAPDLDDNKGLSSIVCHSDKGSRLFSAIQPNLCWRETQVEDVKKYNSNYCKSAPMGKKREDFWNEYDTISFNVLFEKYCKPEKNNGLKHKVKELWLLLGRVIKR